MSPRAGAVLFCISLAFVAYKRLGGVEGGKPETLVSGGYDNAEVEAARARAVSEVDNFIVELEKGNGTDFGVKVPITDAGNKEHFWLTDVVYKDGKFHGKIGNEPGIVQNVTMGQDWTVAKNDISDWMFMRDGKIHGNYTLRPLLKSLPPDKAAKLRSMLAQE